MTDCPCTIGQVPGQKVPWNQHACLSPDGENIFHLEYEGGVTPYAVSHYVPSLSSSGRIALPNTGHWAGVGVSITGLCTDADGTLWCGVRQNVASAALDPDFQYSSAMYKREAGTWTKVWEDTYGSNTAEGYTNTYEDISVNGIFYDAHSDKVLFITQTKYWDGGNHRTKFYRIRDAKTGGGLVHEDGPAAMGSSIQVGAQYGVSQFVIDPNNGNIWNTTLGNALGSAANTVLLRRWLPGFTSPLDIDHEVLSSGGTSMPLPAPGNPGHALCATRPDGTASSYQIRRFDPDGNVVEVTACPNNSIYWPLFTPDLSRVSSLLYVNSSQDDVLVDWTLLCDSDLEPCTCAETTVGSFEEQEPGQNLPQYRSFSHRDGTVVAVSEYHPVTGVQDGWKIRRWTFPGLSYMEDVAPVPSTYAPGISASQGLVEDPAGDLFYMDAISTSAYNLVKWNGSTWDVLSTISGADVLSPNSLGLTRAVDGSLWFSYKLAGGANSSAIVRFAPTTYAQTSQAFTSVANGGEGILNSTWSMLATADGAVWLMLYVSTGITGNPSYRRIRFNPDMTYSLSEARDGFVWNAGSGIFYDMSVWGYRAPDRESILYLRSTVPDAGYQYHGYRMGPDMVEVPDDCGLFARMPFQGTYKGREAVVYVDPITQGGGHTVEQVVCTRNLWIIGSVGFDVTA